MVTVITLLAADPPVSGARLEASAICTVLSIFATSLLPFAAGVPELATHLLPRVITALQALDALCCSCPQVHAAVFVSL